MENGIKTFSPNLSTQCHGSGSLTLCGEVVGLRGFIYLYYLFVLWFGWGFTFSVFSSLPLVYSSLSVYPFLSKLMYCNCVHADVCVSLQLSLFLPPPCCVVKSLSKCSVFSCFNYFLSYFDSPSLETKHTCNRKAQWQVIMWYQNWISIYPEERTKSFSKKCCMTFEIKQKGGVVYPTARNFQ